MRIKTRLGLNSLISIIVLILIVLSLVWSFREMSKATRDMDLVEEMRRVAFERVVLRDDYLLNQEQRARIQWYAKTDALLGLLNAASQQITGGENIALVMEAQREFDATRSSFSKFMEVNAREGRTDKRGFGINEAETRLIGQVFLKAYALNDTIGRLYESLLKQRTTTRNRSIVLIALCLFCGGTAIVINSISLERILARRIAALGRGVEIIGAGDLDYCITVEGDDELSGLARAGNNMAAKLKESHTSVDNLQREIDHRARTESALRETSDYLDKLIGYANAPIIVWDPLFRITRFNHAFESLTGRKAEDVTGQSLEILFPRNQVESSMELIRKTLSGERWEAVEINILNLDGTIRIVLWNSATILATDGTTPVATIAQGQDITQRKQADDALRESEERFRRAIVDSPFPVLLHAEDGMILQASNSWCEITGYSREELVTISDWTELAYGERKSLVQADIDRLYGMSHRITEGDFTIRTKQGCTRIWEFSSAPLGCLPDGRRLVISMAMDVTERRKSEKEIEDKNAELERFVYTVSHDLKSPVVTLKTFIGYLEEDLLDSDEAAVRKDIGYMRAAADKMGRLLDELLEMSRVGRVVNPPVLVSFSELVDEALNVVAGSIAENGVEVIFVEADIPLYGDRLRLMEIWQNLIENAVKYMGERQSPLIEVGVETGGEETVFFVRDNGIGIDPLYKEKIFGLFEKLDPKSEGSGLGLALVKRIISIYHGSIWVESELGKGACFLFTLPEAITRKTTGVIYER